MAQVVQIELQVDQTGAVTAFRNIDTSGTKVATTIKAVAAAGTQMGQAVQQGANTATAAVSTLTHTYQQSGQAAQQAGAAGSAAMKKVGEHALNSMDSVRLFRDEFGIHIPRSMEKTMAQSKLVMSTLNAMQGAMIAVGGIGVFVALATQIYDVYEKLSGANDEMEKFKRNLAEAAQQKFFDASGLTEGAQNFQVAEQQRAYLENKQKTGVSSNWQRVAGFLPGATPDMVDKAWNAPTYTDKDQKQLEFLTKLHADMPLKAEKERHEKVMADLETEAKQISSMRPGAARDAQESRNKGAITRENFVHGVHDKNIEADIHNGMEPNGPRWQHIDALAPNPELQNGLAVDDAEAAAKRVTRERETSDEIHKLRVEANDADLKGFQLLEAQKAEAQYQFVLKYGQNTAAMDAIAKKFHEQELQRQRELTAEIDKRSREADGAGVKGVAAIQHRGDDRVAQINSDYAAGKYDAYATQPERERARDKDIASAKRQTSQELVEEQSRFTDTVDQLSASSADRQVQGFARIRAEGDKELQALQKRFDDVYGDMKDKSSPEYRQGLATLNSGRATINASTDTQMAQLSAKNKLDTDKLERDSYAKSGSQSQQRVQEIRAQYADELAAYTQMLSQKEIAQDDFNRRSAAAERKMQSELAAEAKAQRDRLAGEIEPFFKNPLDAMKNIGEKQASKYAATVLMKASGGKAPDADHAVSNLLHLPKLGTSAKGGAAHSAEAAAHALSQMSVTATTVIVNGATVQAGSSAVLATQGARRIMTPIAAGQGSHAGSIGNLSGFGNTASGSGLMGTSSTGSNMPQLAPATALPDGSSSTAGSFGTADKVASATSTGMQDIQTLSGLGKKLFNKNDDGSDSGDSQDSQGGLSGAMGKAAPAVSAGLGIFGAIESNGGAGGALQGAMSGMQLGAMVGGPAGAAVGAAAGAILGFIGIGGASKADQYYNLEVKPRIANDVTQFGMGAMDYSSANDDLVKLDQEAREKTKGLGMGGKRAWDEHIHPDIMAAIKNLDREQRAGRSQYGTAAAQFHSGGLVTGFGDFATSPNEGFAHLKVGETVMHERATATHGDALDMMLAGASRNQMSDYYGGGAAAMSSSYRAAMQQAAFGGGGHTFNYGDTNHISAIDTKSFEDALVANKHAVRKAGALSYAENSGGADLG